MIKITLSQITEYIIDVMKEMKYKPVSKMNLKLKAIETKINRELPDVMPMLTYDHRAKLRQCKGEVIAKLKFMGYVAEEYIIRIKEEDLI